MVEPPAVNRLVGGSNPLSPARHVGVNPTVWMIVCETISFGSTPKHPPRLKNYMDNLKRLSYNIYIER